MSFLYKFLLVLPLLFSVIQAKVNIFAHYFNQPDYVQYQARFFEKNLLDEYEFFVFEDSRDPEIAEEIRQECEKYGATYISVPRSCFGIGRLPIFDFYVDLLAPSYECAVAIQYIYETYIVPSKDICLILDNDIFLLSPFSIEKYLNTAAFSYPPEQRGEASNLVYYMLPNFVILDPFRMPEKDLLNFNLGEILGSRTDSGGYSYFYLREYKSLGEEMRRYYLFNTPSHLKARYGAACPLLFGSQKWSSHFFIAPDLFLHLRMGSNWARDPDYPQMKQEMEFLFTSLLEDSR